MINDTCTAFRCFVSCRGIGPRLQCFTHCKVTKRTHKRFYIPLISRGLVSLALSIFHSTLHKLLQTYYFKGPRKTFLNVCSGFGFILLVVLLSCTCCVLYKVLHQIRTPKPSSATIAAELNTTQYNKEHPIPKNRCKINIKCIKKNVMRVYT